MCSTYMTSSFRLVVALLDRTEKWAADEDDKMDEDEKERGGGWEGALRSEEEDWTEERSVAFTEPSEESWRRSSGSRFLHLPWKKMLCVKRKYEEANISLPP